MPRQLNLTMHPARRAPFELRLDAGDNVNWRALDRRAARMAEAMMRGSVEMVRQGLSIRRYTETIALLDTLRSSRAGKRLKRAARRAGRRLPVTAALLTAITPAGRRLHADAARLEQKAIAWEASLLCG